MLDRLHSSFKILAKQAPAGEDSIAQAQEKFGRLPDEFLELIREATDLELGHSAGAYLRFWGPAGCVEMDEAYDISRRIPGAIPIGDDGGHPILYMGGNHKPYGLYLSGWGDLDAEDAVWVASSLSELLVEARGLDAF